MKRAALVILSFLASRSAAAQSVPTPSPSMGLGNQATAELVDAAGKSRGRVTFTQGRDGVRVEARVTGLKAHSSHGFHIHEGFECVGPTFETAKDHFNPEKKSHGDRTTAEKHPGDLGNLKANASGVASLNATLKDITLDQGSLSVVGRALIVHAKADDLKTQPSGNSGDRIACGVIKGRGAQP